MRSGRILRFDEVRGYGFIVPDGGGEDVFVHANELLDDKAAFGPGTAVEFEVTEGERGLKAFAVRAVSPPSNGAASSIDRAPTGDGPDDMLCDVLSRAEFSREIVDVLLAEVPELTGAQIVKVRRSLVEIAHKHGWIDD
ncbi:cold shock domain-containing protein [Actinomadura spongiicola]|uniref:Cold shock domain-containing protein n=1 Tax=Actinomadura spongiicola TaxID=2303421 RepID=A0A372GC12_9ACTN|nr:cold shock domain-containing protein [Actinomadura spongiicola]RFS82935.1 cold shock domain-containing protein [Actinomadura spongiicola]